MSLRRKTLLVLLSTGAALLLVVTTIVSRVVRDSFVQLEIQNTRRNVARVRHALAAELAAIDRYAVDWANWDNAYAFVADRNPEFVETNLVPQTLPGLELNLLAVTDTLGRVVVARTHDPIAGDGDSLPRDAAALLGGTGPLACHADTLGRRGIVVAGSGPLLAAARPILRSDRTGPSRGTLVMARSLDDTLVQNLAQTTHLSVVALAPDDPRLPALPPARTWADDENAAAVLPLGPDSVAGYALIQDAAGRPVLALQVTQPRAIYKRGLAALGYIHVAVFIACLVIGALMLLVVECWVLGRLSRLTRDVVAIGRQQARAGRVAAAGRDELAVLGREINRTLDELAAAERQRQSLFDLAIMHDFGTPLTVLQSYLDLIADLSLGPLTDRQRQALTAMVARVQKLIRVRQEILEVSGFDSGSIHLARAPADVKALVEACLAEAAPLARDRGVELIRRLRPAPALCDEKRLKQALDNVLATVLKYAAAGTRIMVATSREDGHVRFSAADESDATAGPAFTERYAAGIESALANAIIQAHGGRLWTETGPDTTPAVHFTIPANA